jgi:hypothetical protein
MKKLTKAFVLIAVMSLCCCVQPEGPEEVTTEPENPVQTDPEQPENPGDPEEPGVPEEPEQPGIPGVTDPVLTFDFTSCGEPFIYPADPISEKISEADSYVAPLILKEGSNWCCTVNYMRSGTRAYNGEYGIKWVSENGGYLFVAAGKDSYFEIPAPAGLTLTKVEFTFFKDNTTGSATIGIYDSEGNALSEVVKMTDSEPIELTPDRTLQPGGRYRLILSKGESKKDRQAVRSIVFHYSGTEEPSIQYIGIPSYGDGVLSSGLYVNAMASGVSCGFEYKACGAGEFVPLASGVLAGDASQGSSFSASVSLSEGDVVRAWASAGGAKAYSGECAPMGDIPMSAPGVRLPDSAHAPSASLRNGIPSIAVSDGGRIWVSWYASKTKDEDETNYLVLASSTDAGKSWKQHLICDPDGYGPRRVFDPEIWLAPDGKLRWVWTDRLGNSKNTPDLDRLWMMTLDPETGATLEEPKEIATGIMVNKPVVLGNGDWMFPVARWKAAPSACAYVTSDKGNSFTFVGGVTLGSSLRGFDEHTIVRKNNGDLKVYMRVANSPDNCLWEANSTDGGKTWSEAVPCVPQTLGSRVFVTRLSSGKWLMVKNGRRDELLSSRARLTALISEDEGKTWTDGVELDPRDKCAYPDGCQASDGKIYIVNDYDRTGAKEISYVVVTEDKLAAGSPVPERIVVTL